MAQQSINNFKLLVHPPEGTTILALVNGVPEVRNVGKRERYYLTATVRNENPLLFTTDESAAAVFDYEIHDGRGILKIHFNGEILQLSFRRQGTYNFGQLFAQGPSYPPVNDVTIHHNGHSLTLAHLLNNDHEHRLIARYSTGAGFGVKFAGPNDHEPPIGEFEIINL
mmetsp:Transcript_9607/g.8587  ORF Transcript_9607/g.8587 Transcript_9607/m.8587 type:complete len:168 (-) Transcript_9607:60-563(-)